MEHYIVSARKYRPSSFATVIGQKPISAALKHAVATDRLAHSYLFCGSRGVGKTSCARIFAKTINCRHRTPDGEACNECDSCRDFNNGTSLNIIELDAASHNGIQDIKDLIEQTLSPPTSGRYRVFIIDEVHMLSSAAFNAFLKTLEEPPEYVIFILATTEKHKIIPTILSRCQIYDFNRITIQDMVEHLARVGASEGIATEEAALNVIARKADGAMRDALSIFDQVAASSMGNVTYQNTIDNLNILDNTYYTRLIDDFVTGNVPEALLIYKDIREKGFDSQFFINGLALFIRDLMVAQNPATLPLLEATDDIRAQMAATAAKCTPSWIYAAMDLCNTADLNYRLATNKQFLIELTLVKLCQLITPAATPKPQTMKPLQPQTTPQAPANHTPQTGPVGQTPQTRQTSQTSQTPSQAPTPAPPRTSARSGLPSFSIRGAQPQKTADNTAADEESHAETRNESYTTDQLRQAWTAFIDAHPTERILINTMKAGVPVKGDTGRYIVIVDDTMQVDAINDAKTEILKFMRDNLLNDAFDFDISMRTGEASPITWTQREVLTHMVEKHPQIRDLIETFSLTL